MSSELEARLKKLEGAFAKLPDFIKKIDVLSSDVKELKHSVEFFSKDIEEFRKSFKETVEEVKLLKKQVGVLESEKLAMRKHFIDLKNSMEDMAFERKSLEFEIQGIPRSVGESGVSLMKYVSNLCLVASVTCSSEDVVKVQRQVRKDGKDGPILVAFSDKKKRDEVYSKLKKKRPSTKDLGLLCDFRAIYINESLSLSARSLLYHARKFKKDNRYKYVWSKNGRVYLKKDDESKAVLINILEDLEVLKN